MLSQYRWQVVLFTAVLAAAIFILCPNYLKIQRAPDVDRFRRGVDTYGATRVRWAARLDLAFAASYAMLGATFSGCGSLAVIGALAVAFAALSDEAENILVLAGISRRELLNISGIRKMRSFGLLKSAGLAFGVALIAFGCIRG